MVSLENGRHENIREIFYAYLLIIHYGLFFTGATREFNNFFEFRSGCVFIFVSHFCM